MKHLLQILKDNGYEPYRCGIIFETQNTSAKEQTNMFLKSTIVFLQVVTKKEEHSFTNLTIQKMIFRV